MILCVLGACGLRSEVPQEVQWRLRAEMTSQHASIGEEPLYQRVQEIGERAGVTRSELIELLLSWVEQGYRLEDSEANASTRVLASTSVGVAARLGNATLIPLLVKYAAEAEYPTNEVAASSAINLAYNEDPGQLSSLARRLEENANVPVYWMLIELVRWGTEEPEAMPERVSMVLNLIRELYFSADFSSPIYVDETLTLRDPAHRQSESRYQFLMRLRSHENPRRRSYAEEQLNKDFTERMALAEPSGVPIDAPAGSSAQQTEVETGGPDQEGSGQTTEERSFPTGPLIVALIVGGLLYAWMRFMHHQ